ncbi:hypothetical protein BCh11DRAFT_06448 [Burkholderia sp. Ch1-1]|nr:hypothetical protein BCh11DRAFT_06448 [Burkholderia sp. Ch1-1]
MFDFLKPKPKTSRREEIAGLIGYFNLGEWWYSSLTEHERQRLDGNRLTKDNILGTSETPTKVFTGLANGCGKDATPDLYRKLMALAEQYRNDDRDIIATHFMLQSQAVIYFRNRETWPNAVEAFVRACREEVRISSAVAKAFKKDTGSLPTNTTLQKYARFLEEEGKLDELKELILKAKKEHWPGKWG